MARAVGLAQRWLVAFHAFHVTFPLGGDNVHFYYHEHLDNVWEHGGHTAHHHLDVRVRTVPAWP